MKYTKKTPCDNCPFRSDKPFALAKSRVQQIQTALVRGEFACHKTTVDVDDSDGSGDRRATAKSVHCAGALILMEKVGQPSQMMRICERIGMYDPSKLDMSAPVYETWSDMVEGCSMANEGTSR